MLNRPYLIFQTRYFVRLSRCLKAILAVVTAHVIPSINANTAAAGKIFATCWSLFTTFYRYLKSCYVLEYFHQNTSDKYFFCILNTLPQKVFKYLKNSRF